MEFHVVTNGKLPFSEVLHFMKKAGSKIDYLHIREKEKTAMELYEGVLVLIRNGIPAGKIVMNDRVDVAAAAGLKRVQLGYRSLSPSITKRVFPGLHTGQSVHSLEEALEAQEAGADSVLFGHLFETESKKERLPQGIGKAKELANHLTVDMVAIGGIEPGHIQALAEEGIHGFAVMSGIWESSDPACAASEYRRAIKHCKEAPK